jgi:hypothetical protein
VESRPPSFQLKKKNHKQELQKWNFGHLLRSKHGEIDSKPLMLKALYLEQMKPFKRILTTTLIVMGEHAKSPA